MANYRLHYRFVSVLISICVLLPMSALAEPRGSSLGGGRLQANETFRVGQVLGDGKSGRAYAKWSQRIQDRGVESVMAVVRRQSGGNGTYVNLRYGDDSTFENGKRVYLKDNRSQSVSWNVGGQAPGGRPLVLNAYDGEVVLESVEVRYQGGSSSPAITPPQNPFTPGPKPIPRPGHNYDDDDDNYHGGGYSSAESADPEALSRCRRAHDLRRPRIELGDMRPSGGLFSGKYKVRGNILGNCIEEAGYYENGRLKEKFEIPLNDRFQRKEFSVTVRSGRNGEIRVFNTRGDDDSIEVDREIQDSQSSQGNQFNF